MYWRTNADHRLRHNPFSALVAPRPIGWISTWGPDRRPNLAPYSFFNAVSYTPPQLIFSVGARPEGVAPPLKDTLANVQATGCFVHNLVTWDLREAMNKSSAECPPEIDEFEIAGLTAIPAHEVDAPCVKESPVRFECRLLDVIDTKSQAGFTPNRLVLGEVIGIAIDESMITDGMIDYARTRPVARLGYLADYADTTSVFRMQRPPWP